MKARLLLFLWSIVAVAGCTKDDTILFLSMQEQDKNSGTRFERNPIDLYKFTDSTIVLGSKLENPYSVSNLQIARDSLIASGMTPQEVPAILPTHYYARFKPADDDALAELMERDTTIIYYEFPLDYEIKEYGVSYHDPAIADTLPTYQYASVPIAQWQNLQDIPNVECTMLEALCILDEDKDGSHLGPITPIDPDPFLPDPRDTLPFKPVIPPGGDKIESVGNVYLSDAADNTDSGNYDESAISALMSKSFELTGNGDYEEPSMTRASSKWQPAGRITVYDNIAGGQIPLVGAKVRARRWFTTYKGITNNIGEFTCNGKFKNPANYSIIWKRSKFKIKDGNTGQAYYNGPKIKGDWNLNINNGNSKSLRFATIHRAAHRMFYNLVSELKRPQSSKCLPIKYFNKINKENGSIGGLYSPSTKKVKIWGKVIDDETEVWVDISNILSNTFHELGHAAHHTNANGKFNASTLQHKESWACFVQYILTRLEYEKLGLYKNTYSAYLDDDNCYEPDDKHNMQNWQYKYNAQNTKHNIYTPIYIDLNDMFNQQNYYKKISPNSYTLYPNDDIHIMTAALQDFVFKSTSIADIKQKILDYMHLNPHGAQAAFNLTEENINNLFRYYE